MRWSIAVNDAKYRAPIGVHKQEQLLGNEIVISASIFFEAEKINTMAQSHDYAVLYNILTEEVAIPCQLLEQLLSRIAYSIEEKFSTICEYKIVAYKVAPPFGGDIKSTSVSCEKKINSNE